MSNTIDLDTFVEHIERGEIPPGPPHCVYDGYDYSYEGMVGRKECVKRGMWAIVEQGWVSNLSKWVGNRKCLEIMAGAGWLSKALNDKGVDVIATDDYSWDGNQHSPDMVRVYPVECVSAVDAVASPEPEVLIVSWPPYDNRDIIYACRRWGTERPVVYIGEEGGCNAPNEFFRYFHIEDEIGIPQWYGIHDRLIIGKYDESY